MAVPAAPTDLLAIVVDAGDIDLSWTDNDTNEDGFRIERSLASVNDWETIGQTLPDAPSFREAFAVPEVSYDYRVFAFNLDGDSAASNIVTAETPVPPDLAVFPPPVSPVDPPRNRIQPDNVEFKSPGIYGLERNVDGSVTGFKY